ncbi:MAG: molybdopterin-dependent oxidoreductase, partial [Boseongicola sp.]|nr:molybdopterin-dependent oxidoreductase [Boseongicola sp.]
MAGRYKSDLKWSDVTPKRDYMNRRQLMAGAGALALGSIAGPAMASLGARKTSYGRGLEVNTFEDITSYNNFYEFGTGKDDPKNNAGRLTTDPWSITVDGMVDKPGKYDLDDLNRGISLEERIYRFRCVEAWSMGVPWVGFELSDLLARVGVQ